MSYTATNEFDDDFDADDFMVAFVESIRAEAAKQQCPLSIWSHFQTFLAIPTMRTRIALLQCCPSISAPSSLGRSTCAGKRACSPTVFMSDVCFSPTERFLFQSWFSTRWS